MRDIAEELHAWHKAGKAYAVATVVAVRGSAPREPGAALAVDAEGTAVGSVSGGCVEGAVYELCVESLRHGQPVLETFGYSDDDAFAVGLTCGGELEVFIQPVFPDREDAIGEALTAVASGEPIALARVIGGPAELVGRAMAVSPRAPEILWGPPGASIAVDGDPWSATGSIGGELDRVVARHARAMVESGAVGAVPVGTEGEGQECGEQVTVFIESFVTAPRMLIFGAIDFAAALVRVGKYLGYHVTVCDARPVFATRRRFPEADDVVVAWPHRYLETTRVDARTVVAVLTHDAKFDVPLLVKALRTPVAYVGAMGSRRTCAQRADRLREAGLTEAEIAALHAPIGLDLGARTAEETALSIAAEIVAARYGGTGRGLGDVTTAIHQPEPEPSGSGVLT
jgi:xanthine dehydrogenase accessory factor